MSDNFCVKYIIILFISIFVLGSGRLAVAQQGTGDVFCPTGQVCRVSLTKLPLLALSRPYSNLYKTAAADKGQLIRENMPAFFPLYVYTRPAEAAAEVGGDARGWYQVGTSIRSPLGWMQAKDLFEWRQALVVSYKHWGVGDETRQRVVLFKDLPSLTTVVESSARAADARSLYDQISKKSVPPAIISIEPNRFVDIDKNFYLLPILDFKEVANFDDRALYLMLAAAVPKARAAPGEVIAAVKSGSASMSEQQIMSELSDVAVDIVFVVDMTASMQPWITGVKTAITDLARSISRDEKVNRRLRFGFVGYRDNVDIIPSLEWTTKNFTPQLVSDTQFLELVGGAQEAKVSSIDYPEEVYAGIKAGIGSAWRPNSLRFMIHVGDASGHEPGHPQNTTGDLDARALRLVENEQKITAFSIHMRDGRAQSDWSIAQAQFEELTRNPGAEKKSMYFPVATDDPTAYDKAVKDIAGDLSVLLDPTKSRAVQQVVATGTFAQSGQTLPPADEVQTDVDKAVAAALITYLGQETTPPRDVTGWAFDRDLIDPRKSALDVKILMSKDDLNNLITALEVVTDAVKEIKVTKMGLFDTLQGLSANVMKNREEISFQGAKNLAQTRLLPAFISSLPYKSAILSLTTERYAAMTTEEVSELETRLKGNLAFYRELYNSPAVWKQLNDGDAEGEKVNPVSLFALP